MVGAISSPREGALKAHVLAVRWARPGRLDVEVRLVIRALLAGLASSSLGSPGLGSSLSCPVVPVGLVLGPCGGRSPRGTLAGPRFISGTTGRFVASASVLPTSSTSRAPRCSNGSVSATSRPSWSARSPAALASSRRITNAVVWGSPRAGSSAC